MHTEMHGMCTNSWVNYPVYQTGQIRGPETQLYLIVSKWSPAEDRIVFRDLEDPQHNEQEMDAKRFTTTATLLQPNNPKGQQFNLTEHCSPKMADYFTPNTQKRNCQLSMCIFC